MAIDARVALVWRSAGGSGYLSLADRPPARPGDTGGVRGQGTLTFDSSPEEVLGLSGRDVWGDVDALMLGETRIARRVGYAGLVFEDAETVRAVLAKARPGGIPAAEPATTTPAASGDAADDAAAASGFGRAEAIAGATMTALKLVGRPVPWWAWLVAKLVAWRFRVRLRRWMRPAKSGRIFARCPACGMWTSTLDGPICGAYGPLGGSPVSCKVCGTPLRVWLRSESLAVWWKPWTWGSTRIQVNGGNGSQTVPRELAGF